MTLFRIPATDISLLGLTYAMKTATLSNRTVLRRKTPLALLLILTVLSSTLVILPVPVFALVGCGSTITTSTTLTRNIGPCPGNGIVIGRSSITLNCAGHTITGTVANTKAGIYLNGKTKVTVKNCHVAAFRYGIEVLGSSYDAFTGNTANSNRYDGFYVSSSLSASSHNTFTSNAANLNTHSGFYLYRSSYNTFTKNAASGNKLYGFYLVSSSHNTLGTALTGNTAKSNKLSGFYLLSSSYNALTKNSASLNGANGFLLKSSTYNILVTNTAVDSTLSGFNLTASSHNTLRGNAASDNGVSGIYLVGSSNNNLTMNIMTFNFCNF
jgi:parallel beta-helix repeat protein